MGSSMSVDLYIVETGIYAVYGNDYFPFTQDDMREFAEEIGVSETHIIQSNKQEYLRPDRQEAEYINYFLLTGEQRNQFIEKFGNNIIVRDFQETIESLEVENRILSGQVNGNQESLYEEEERLQKVITEKLTLEEFAESVGLQDLLHSRTK